MKVLNIGGFILENRRIIHIKELSVHKKHLIDSCCKMAIYFLENDNEKLALELMERAFIHDISKVSIAEFHAQDAFGSYSKYSESKDKNFTEDEQKFLRIHWSNNRHHPEYWTDVNDMEEIDVVEMVCDWHARSVEFGNDLIAYIKHRQKTRFAFPEQMYGKIIYYADILTKK